MKNMSILKTVNIVQLVASVLLLINLTFKEQLGEKLRSIFGIMGLVLMITALILIFWFRKKIEQEKIEREERKREVRKKIV